jgi:hypothetical protein
MAHRRPRNRRWLRTTGARRADGIPGLARGHSGATAGAARPVVGRISGHGLGTSLVHGIRKRAAAQPAPPVEQVRDAHDRAEPADGNRPHMLGERGPLRALPRAGNAKRGRSLASQAVRPHRHASDCSFRVGLEDRHFSALWATFHTERVLARPIGHQCDHGARRELG